MNYFLEERNRQITELNCRFMDDTWINEQRPLSHLDLPLLAIFFFLNGPCALYGIEIADAERAVFIQHRRKMDRENFPTLMEVLDSCPAEIFLNMNSVLRTIITLPSTALRSSMLTGR